MKQKLKWKWKWQKQQHCDKFSELNTCERAHSQKSISSIIKCKFIESSCRTPSPALSPALSD